MCRSKATKKMTVDPSKSTIRSRLQTNHKWLLLRATVASVMVKLRLDLSEVRARKTNESESL